MSRLPVYFALAAWFLALFAAALVAQEPRGPYRVARPMLAVQADDETQSVLIQQVAARQQGPPGPNAQNGEGLGEFAKDGEFSGNDVTGLAGNSYTPFGPAPDGEQDPFRRDQGPAPDGRYTGRGEPLYTSSWLNHPLSFGGFVGNFWGQELVKGQYDQSSGLFAGFRLGWDFDNYWGTEMRLGFAQTAVTHDVPPFGEWTDHIWLTDFNLLYYPWGDARWRPYFTIGIGANGFNFHDLDGRGNNDIACVFPFGIGLKYRIRNWFVARVDILDNYALAGGGMDSMHNYSITGGVEYRFGGAIPSYWPW